MGRAGVRPHHFSVMEILGSPGCQASLEFIENPSTSVMWSVTRLASTRAAIARASARASTAPPSNSIAIFFFMVPVYPKVTEKTDESPQESGHPYVRHSAAYRPRRDIARLKAPPKTSSHAEMRRARLVWKGPYDAWVLDESLTVAARSEGIEKHVVGAVVHHAGAVLLLTRSVNDTFLPGIEELPSGGVEDGETLAEALDRELLEEVGFSA